MRQIPWALALLLVAAQATAAPNPSGTASPTLTLEKALALALKNNPGLSAAAARAKAAAEAPPQAGSLPDPRLSLDALNLPVDTFSTTQENMTQLRVGLSQDIPFPGKLDLRKTAAERLAEATRLDVDEYRLKLARNVRIEWWNIFYLDRAIAIVRRNQTLLRQFITIAQTKYKVGKGLQQDVLLAQVELSKLLDAEIRLKGAREQAVARLNAWLGRAADTPVVLPESAPAALPAPPEERRLLETALARRPLLARQDKIIAAAEARVELAEKDYYPDFRLGAAYGFRQGNNTGRTTPRADFASFGLSMNLPIFTDSKQDRALEQARAEKARAGFTRQDLRDAVMAEVSQALADYRKAREQARLFKTGIIPQASQTVASMLAGYQVSKVDFLNLVRAQITLYDYETRYWLATSQAWQAWARLEAAIGQAVQPSTPQEQNP